MENHGGELGDMPKDPPKGIGHMTAWSRCKGRVGLAVQAQYQTFVECR
jgi:hypothetical protein